MTDPMIHAHIVAWQAGRSLYLDDRTDTPPAIDESPPGEWQPTPFDEVADSWDGWRWAD